MRLSTILCAVSALSLSGCGWMVLGKESWLKTSDEAWGSLQPGSRLISSKRQEGTLTRSGSLYLNPLGISPQVHDGSIGVGEVLEAERLKYHFSGTFGSYILYLKGEDGNEVKLDVGGSILTAELIERLGFRILD